MSRKKVDNIVIIKDLAQANAALGELGAIDRSLEEITSRMNAVIDQVKQRAEADAAPLKDRSRALAGGLKAFAEHQKDSILKDRKSVELAFGRIGFRKSTQVKPAPKSTWKQILGRLRELGFEAAIRIKEEINKDELHTWSDERLELVGARRVPKDEFWYEVKAEELEGGS